jgi:uncharacterized protein with von Willebrand factor type A (vWA) domain
VIRDDATIDGRVDLALVASAFGDRLHRAGVPTTPERSGRFAEILSIVRPARIEELYWAARLAFVIDRSSLDLFDRVFSEVFRGTVDVDDVTRNPNVPASAPAQPGAQQRRDEAVPAGGSSTESRPPAPMVPGDEDPGDEDGPSRDAVLAAASADHSLAAKPFGACTIDELAELGRLIARLPLVAPVRSSRRTRRHRHGADIHWRATLRDARRTGGDPVRHIRRRERTRRRRVVLIADVSGSMEDYARAYLYLLHGAVRALHAEAFVFSTQLSRLTRALAEVNPNVALMRAKVAAPDWSGGTRIGEALREFNDGWGRRGVARGAVVVIVSDGWEAGPPELLAREMARLSRLAHRIVWVNPRRQSPRFQPLAGGMAAALPFVDSFVSGHSLDALDEVLAAIAS